MDEVGPMDDLDRAIATRTARDPAFPELLAAEIRRLELITRLVAERKASRLSQAAVAKAMNVTQPVIAEIEAGRADIRYSTLDRYIDAVTGHRMRLDLVPVSS
jgi:ribosome-binding protein aMBF1 (putative translation factor)